MRGIASIRGTTAPLIGQDAFYEVSALYPGTAISDYSQVKWKVFRKANGAWVELRGTLKTGRRVSFNFPQKWYGEELLIEAFLSNPEKKIPPGMVIRPVLGPKKIKTIELRDANGNAITQKPKYGQTITARVTTENMLGDTLRLSIWERDTLAATGHDSNGNTKLWNGNVRVTDSNGVATERIMLSPAMMTNSNKSWFEGGEHEYYMLVQADNTPPKYSPQTLSVENKEIVLSPNMPRVRPAQTQQTTLQLLEQMRLRVLNAMGIDTMPATGRTNTTINPGATVPNCGERYCVKKGEKSELIREINIRLSGFGGNVPTDEFTDRTEKTVKQFQKDYMKITPTGKICGNTLKAIDEFGVQYTYDFSQSKCTCGTCTGYGDGSNKGEYTGTAKTEMYHKYEYPGIHRSLFWALKAVVFYMQKDGGTYSLNKISSGYRCRVDNQQNGRSSTNHMGKALDIHFNKNGQRTRVVADIEAIRKDIYVKYLGAQYSWPAANKFSLETTAQGASTWVHYDVRSFESTYLEDKYFAKTDAAVKGETMVALALAQNLTNLCQCMGEGINATAPAAGSTTDRVDVNTLSLSEKGKQFIKDWEKFEPLPYNDSEDYCTVGYGHLIARDKCENITIPDEFKTAITEARASELFNSRLSGFETNVKSNVTVKLYQYEYDALVSLTFNSGSLKYPNLKRKLNSEDYDGAAAEFLDITNGGTAGLVTRRKAENNMFLNNVYDSTH